MKTFREFIDEISKATLGRYVTKASQDAGEKMYKLGVHAALYDYRGKDKDKAVEDHKTAKKMSRRLGGISKAAARLTNDQYRKKSTKKFWESKEERHSDGDRVRIVYGRHTGKKGTVVQTAPSGKFHGVESDKGEHLGYYHASDIRRIRQR